MKTELKRCIHKIYVFSILLNILFLLAFIVELFLVSLGNWFRLIDLGVLLAVFLAYYFFLQSQLLTTAVLELIVDGTIVKLVTYKKTYGYDLSCVKTFKTTDRKYIVWFEDDSSCEKFIFYRRLPIGKTVGSSASFSKEELSVFGI